MDIMKTDEQILKEIGARLRSFRLNLNIPIKKIAEHTHISRNTILKIEHGENFSMLILIKLLRAYNLLDHLEELIPDNSISPKQLFEMKGKKRQRASSKRSKK